jgi:ABC-type multidrug transport system ATPase subunit
MEVNCIDIGKRFNRDWIFRHVNCTFSAGNSYAVTGPNGSGKSTLLQAIAGSLHLSEGALEYSNQQDPKTIEPEKFYQYISIAAPYLELIEEMTGREFLHFHQQFKSLLSSITVEEILTEIGLEKCDGQTDPLFQQRYETKTQARTGRVF